MKAFILISASFGLAVSAGLVLAQPQTQPGIAKLNQDITQAAQRACLFPAGGWTIIDCSNAAAATSSRLNAWSRYVIQCGDDSYISTGVQASDVADSNDGWLPSSAWLEFLTSDSVRYISCLNKTMDSDCRIWECR